MKVIFFLNLYPLINIEKELFNQYLINDLFNKFEGLIIKSLISFTGSSIPAYSKSINLYLFLTLIILWSPKSD